MPKQQLTINKFEGGLNTNSDPRDIADNEFSALEGFDVDSIGMIKMMGTHGDHSVITSSATNNIFGASTNFAEGYGIFPFSSAYDDSGALVSTNYLALTDGTYVHIFDDIGTTWNGMDAITSSTGFSLGEVSQSATDVYASFYSAEGNLRVSDGNFDNYENVPKLLQYIQSKTYGKGSNTSYPTEHAQASVGGDWVVNNASIETGVTSSNLKMINLGDHAKGIIEISSGGGGAGGANAINDITANTGTGNPGTVVISNSDLDFGSLSTDNGYYNGHTCSVFGSAGVTKYGVVVDYAYSGGTGTFKIWSHSTGDTDFYTQGARDDSGNWGFQVGQHDGYLWNVDFNGESRNREVISDDWGVTLIFDEGESLDGGWMPKTSTRYKFYHSTIFDDMQHSNPAVFKMYPRKAASGTTAHASVSEMHFADGNTSLNASSPTGGEVGVASTEIPVSFHLLVRMRAENDPDGSGNFTVGDTGFDEEDQDDVDSPGAYNFLGGNQRVTGGMVWWASNEDGYKKLYLLMEYDMEKGGRIITGESSGDGAFAPWISWIYPVATSPILTPSFGLSDVNTEVTNPPVIQDYETFTLYPPDAKLNAKWKTAVVADNKAYVGNIMRQEKSTFNGGGSWSTSTNANQPQYQDLILVSSKDRYDVFPDDPNFQFNHTPGDGDKIIKLETFSNRLIVFYSNKVEVFALPQEELEQEFKYVGLDGENPSQACSTDFGVAWINSKGVYFYGGDRPAILSEKIRNKWIGEDGHEAFWKGGTDGANDVLSIAYDPSSSKLLVSKTIVSGGSDLEHILEFSFKTKSWTYKENALTDTTDKRFTIYKGDLIFDNGTMIQKWSNEAAAGTGSGGNVIHTKDYDFGVPGTRKKIYKVYITYQSGGSATNVHVKYDVNGGTSLDKTFKDGTNFGTSTDNELDAATGWQVAELIPSTSSEANNKYSFRLVFTCDGVVPATFEINDITIIYRIKSIK
jgi:hypothetical protein